MRLVWHRRSDIPVEESTPQSTSNRDEEGSIKRRERILRKYGQDSQEWNARLSSSRRWPIFSPHRFKYPFLLGKAEGAFSADAPSSFGIRDLLKVGTCSISRNRYPQFGGNIWTICDRDVSYGDIGKYSAATFGALVACEEQRPWSMYLGALCQAEPGLA